IARRGEFRRRCRARQIPDIPAASATRRSAGKPAARNSVHANSAWAWRFGASWRFLRANGNLVAALCVILTVAASINRDSDRRLFIEFLTFGEKLPQSGVVPAESANKSANQRRSKHVFSPRDLFYLVFICAGSFRMVSGLPL